MKMEVLTKSGRAKLAVEVMGEGDPIVFLNRPGFRGGCVVKVKRPRRRLCRVGCSSLPQPRLAEYSRSMSAGVYG